MKFIVGVEMEGWAKDGTELEGHELWEDIVIDATDEESAKSAVMDMDFGNRTPTGFFEVRQAG